jgi:two-component system, OmpR family, sensor histidine kinase KdpD
MAGSGQLTTYLGTAPGVGKTYAMLTEGRRREAAGERVVVGWIEHHDRPETIGQVDHLTVIDPGHVDYRGHDFAEMDMAAVMAADADLVIVDELAHSLPDGSRARWTDVADILATGADVLTTVNVANLVAARDYAARLTGAGTVESVPDEFVHSGQVALIDLPAHVLRRRIASGDVYSAERVGGALAEYFRVPNLEALSQLGQAWVAGTLDQVGPELLARRGLADEPPRAVVIAAVSGSEWSGPVIRRAVELACDDDADLVVVHARGTDGPAHGREDALDRYRQMTEEMGGSYAEVDGEPAQAIANLARGRGASRVVVARHRSRLSELARGSVAAQLRRLWPGIQLEEVREAT